MHFNYCVAYLQLFMFNFYPFLQRYLQPHQRGRCICTVQVLTYIYSVLYICTYMYLCCMLTGTVDNTMQVLYMYIHVYYT